MLPLTDDVGGALLFPKGPTRRCVYEVKRKHRADIIRAVRLQVMQRDRACRVCGRTDSAEMHELTPRSLLRGQPPDTIYTLVNCLRLCTRCHNRVTRHELSLTPVSVAHGANGPIRSVESFHRRRNV